MEPSATPSVSAPTAAAWPDDGISLRRWFAAYGLWLVAAAAALAVLIHGSAWSWSAWRHEPAKTFAQTGTSLKLVGLALYLSLCCTFLPLPTGWIVAAVATREAAMAGSLIATVAGVGLAGAVASTLANLNDYHIFTAMLRLHRVAAVRYTAVYRAAARWFGRRPFSVVLIFSIIPIPVDVIRMLAATYRYPRAAFAAANFVGRFLRYAVIAFVTYYWNLGWIAPAVLLVLAAVLGIGRVTADLLGRRQRRRLASADDPPHVGLGD
ncbi:MAG: VTT domain-containing protein [Phycisphaerae bacterium]|nr:VTT domain-containing protein [Phycisphaerae bacterium]